MTREEMQDPTPDPMDGRIVRFSDLERQGTALAFIDSVLPGHHRMNYAVVGDTAVEDPDFKAAFEAPHRFQVGIFECPPGNGPAWHTHEYVELFVPLTGSWTFSYGTDPEGYEEPDGDVELGAWDAISFPPGLWRSFSNTDEQNAWALAVLDPHDAFAFKDPMWPESVVRRAAEHGVEADGQGKMIKPPNYEELQRELTARIRHTQAFSR